MIKIKFIQFIILAFLFTGCSISNLKYNSTENKNITTQLYDNKQCTYYIGPFNVKKEIDINDLIKDTIQKANEDGLYGNKLTNIKIRRGGYTAILFTKYCLFIQGNLIYIKPNH
jgi:hypothetical protein